MKKLSCNNDHSFAIWAAADPLVFVPLISLTFHPLVFLPLPRLRTRQFGCNLGPTTEGLGMQAQNETEAFRIFSTVKIAKTLFSLNSVRKLVGRVKNCCCCQHKNQSISLRESNLDWSNYQNCLSLSNLAG